MLEVFDHNRETFSFLIFFLTLCWFFPLSSFAVARPRSTEAVCTTLQAQILHCYRENRDQTLRCSDLAKEYMQCIDAAKKVRSAKAPRLTQSPHCPEATLKQHYVTIWPSNNGFKIILMVYWLVIGRMASVSLPLHACYACYCTIKWNFGGASSRPPCEELCNALRHHITHQQLSRKSDPSAS